MLRVTPIYGSSLSPSPSPAVAPSTPSTAAAAANNGDDPPEWLSSPLPSCTLVEYAGMKILLNVGWDESLSPGGPRELPDGVDAVLVCDSTLASLGGLPKYFGADRNNARGRAPRSLASRGEKEGEKGGDFAPRNNPPFLATYPTVKMGQMTLYDHHAALSLDGCPPGFTLEDVDGVFGKESFHTLKYSQTCYLPLESDGATADASQHANVASCKRLAVTPHLAGHVVGGCYW